MATKGLALLESIIEINIFGVRDDGQFKKHIVEHKASAPMRGCPLRCQCRVAISSPISGRLGPAAVRAGDLLCLSALFAADDNGAIATAVGSDGLRYLGAPIQHQMRAILDAAGAICKSSGTSLDNVTRAHHFVNDLNTIYPALRIWQEKLSSSPVPFAAVRMPSPMPVPGCDIIADIWAYQPS